jgi:hydrogenase nickel incorporation protein HypA/HybF
MHEMSLMRGLLAAANDALRPYPPGRVTALTVEAGVLANIMPGALSFAFEMQSVNTPFAGAEFCLQIMPLTARCADCGNQYQSRQVPPLCPHCHSMRAEILSGQEVVLKSMEFEEVEMP